MINHFMEKTYTPHSIESTTYTHWENQGYFKPHGSNNPYSIMLPPPNVTGTLHMGHGFEHTLMDVLTRYHRMMGDHTLWQCGTDHSGIATQMIVERKLEAAGSSREAIGREAFLKKTWEWKAESGDNITRQMRRMGTSPDWSRERFTMDEGLSKSVKEAFIRLHQEGLIYRGERLVNWDCKLQTALSDLEVLSSEKQGKMWYIQYTPDIVIATTRPETILGDTAVAVHPEDKRYQHLIGKTITVPIVGRNIPVVADEYVDKDFGSGCVKITPAHDFNDYELGKRHTLPMINVFTEDGHINQNALASYQGLSIAQARKKILGELNVIDTKEHQLNIPISERSGAVVEPRITTQWYVNMQDMAQDALQAVKNHDITFTPENAVNTYNEWLNNIQDWCISRQLWWGHRIPAWYDDQDNVYVGKDERDVRQKNNISDDIPLTQDEDVLDTWFSSALWPFSTLGWPEKTPELTQFYPTDTLVTGFDLIFFWVSRMIMFGLKLTGKVPFKHVYFHGLIRDHLGVKMSKSKGNVLDPVDIIDGIELEPLVAKRTYGLMQPHLKNSIIQNTKTQFPNGIQAYGCDALRFTYCALASTSRDINFDMSRMEGYRNFCNKLWNAGRFILMNVEHYDTNAKYELSEVDTWIWGKLNQTILTSHKAISEYRFDRLSNTLYEFVWNEFCDWYLEMSKVVLYNNDSSDTLKNGTYFTLVNVYEHILRLLHPIIPFITEEIWQSIKDKSEMHNGETIMLQPYPKAESVDVSLTESVEWVKSFITAARTLRSENNIPPAKHINLYIESPTLLELERVNQFKPWIHNLIKADHIEATQTPLALGFSASTLVGERSIYVPLSGLIDIEAEKSKIAKQVEKLAREIHSLSGRLNNTGFTEKAPEAVIQKERLKLHEAQMSLNALHEKLANL